jgi:membrane protein
MKLGLVHEWRHLRSAYEHWQQDDGPLMAAAVAYYLGLSLFPLLLVLIAGVGLVLKYTSTGQTAQQQVIAVIAQHVSPSLEMHVRTALEHVQDRSALHGPIGLVGILLAAIAGFAQFERAFDRIWNIPRPKSVGVVSGLRTILIERGIAFLMLLSMGLLILVVFLSGLVLAHVEAFTENVLPAPDILWSLLQMALTLLLNALLFTLLYRWLTKVYVPWSQAARGGAMAAIGWEIGRQTLAAFLVGNRYSSAYGVIGSFIAILLWCYFAIAVIFLGAEYIQEFSRSSPVNASPAPPAPD